MKPISNKQVGMIFGLARRYGMDGDTLHSLVECHTRKNSIRALSSAEAGIVIDRLKALLGEMPSAPANRATDAQVRLICAIAREMGWMEDANRLRGFLEKRFGCSDVRFLPAAKVSAVIEALKAMRAGGRAERREAVP